MPFCSSDAVYYENPGCRIEVVNEISNYHRAWSSNYYLGRVLVNFHGQVVQLDSWPNKNCRGLTILVDIAPQTDIRLMLPARTMLVENAASKKLKEAMELEYFKYFQKQKTHTLYYEEYFGITDADDLLFVREFVIVKQQVTCVSFRFDDQAVGDFFEEQVDLGRKPEQFARIWLHSHPGNSPQPSSTDEETFTRVFGTCDWSIMFIVARNGNTFARLRFNVGPGGEVNIPVCVDYSCEFEAANFELWKQQYKSKVNVDEIFPQVDESKKPENDQKKEIELFGNDVFERKQLLSSEDLLSEIDLMDPMERTSFHGRTSCKK